MRCCWKEEDEDESPIPESLRRRELEPRLPLGKRMGLELGGSWVEVGESV